MSHLWPLLPPLPSSPCVRPAPLLKKWVREESRAVLMSFLSQPVQAQGPKMDSCWGTLCLSRGPHDHQILWTCPAFLQDFLPGEGAGAGHTIPHGQLQSLVCLDGPLKGRGVWLSPQSQGSWNLFFTCASHWSFG